MAIYRFILFLSVVGWFVGCRTQTMDPNAPVDMRLARVIWTASSVGYTLGTSEEQYQYDAQKRLIQMNLYSRGQDGTLELGQYTTYSYDSVNRLRVKALFTRLRNQPWRSLQESRFTYPSTDKIIETGYLVDAVDKSKPYMTHYVETLLADNQRKQVTYFTKEGIQNGQYKYTYTNNKLVREDFIPYGNTGGRFTIYTYAGNMAKVETFDTITSTSISERQQTLDSKGRVIRDETVKPERGFELPDSVIYTYEYVD